MEVPRASRMLMRLLHQVMTQKVVIPEAYSIINLRKPNSSTNLHNCQDIGEETSQSPHITPQFTIRRAAVAVC